jgi:hypothetical protein
MHWMVKGSCNSLWREETSLYCAIPACSVVHQASYSVYLSLFPQQYCGRSGKLTALLRVQRLRMSGVIPPLPHMPSQHAQGKSAYTFKYITKELPSFCALNDNCWHAISVSVPEN